MGKIRSVIAAVRNIVTSLTIHDAGVFALALLAIVSGSKAVAVGGVWWLAAPAATLSFLGFLGYYIDYADRQVEKYRDLYRSQKVITQFAFDALEGKELEVRVLRSTWSPPPDDNTPRAYVAPRTVEFVTVAPTKRVSASGHFYPRGDLLKTDIHG